MEQQTPLSLHESKARLEAKMKGERFQISYQKEYRLMWIILILLPPLILVLGSIGKGPTSALPIYIGLLSPISAAGVLCLLFFCLFRIDVAPDRMTVHRAFRKKKIFPFNSIHPNVVESIGSHAAYLIFYEKESRKKLFQVNGATTGYQVLKKRLCSLGFRIETKTH